MPEDVRPWLDPLEDTIRALDRAVYQARYDRPSDDPNFPGLTVAEAIQGLERATTAWLARSAALEEVLHVVQELQPGNATELRYCRAGLVLLQAAVGMDLALVRRLEDLSPDVRLRDIPDWPDGGDPLLYDVAFGNRERGESSVLDLMRVGTDDDPAVRDGGFAAGDRDIFDTVQSIVRESAEAVTKVVIGVTAGAVAHAFPLPESGAEHFLREAIDQVADQAFECTLDELDHTAGRVTRLVRLVQRRIRKTLRDLLGSFVGHTNEAKPLASPRGRNEREKQGVVVHLLEGLYGTTSVLDRANKAFDDAGRGQRNHAERRLKQLTRSNKRWVGPVKVLSRGLGLLWPVMLGPVPAAPSAGAALIAWTVMISGDQLDSEGFFPNFWTGVVQRSGGA